MARFGRYKMGFRKGISVNKLVGMLLAVVIGLYVGGQVLETFGDAMENTCSPFYNGFTLIGWTVNANNCLADGATTTGGVLSVVGIVALAYIIKKVIYIKR